MEEKNLPIRAGGEKGDVDDLIFPIQSAPIPSGR